MGSETPSQSGRNAPSVLSARGGAGTGFAALLTASRVAGDGPAMGHLRGLAFMGVAEHPLSESQRFQ